jgi:hypothetical protein
LIGVEKDGGLIVVRMTEEFFREVHRDLTADTRNPYGSPIYTLWSALDDLRWESRSHEPTMTFDQQFSRMSDEDLKRELAFARGFQIRSPEAEAWLEKLRSEEDRRAKS